MYHGDTNERQGAELHMVKKEEGMEKQQSTRPKPLTSRSIANPLAANHGHCQHPLIHSPLYSTLSFINENWLLDYVIQ